MEKCVSKYHKKDQNLDYYLESICFRSMMKSFCSADKEKNIFNFPNPFVPLSSCKSLLLKQWHDFSQFYGLYLISLTISPTYCEPAVFLTVVTWRTQVRPAIQPLVELCLFWSALANLWFTERRLKWAARRKSHICLVSCHSCFFSGSFVLLYCGCHSFWNASGSSFPFPSSWSELLAAWRSVRQEKRSRWFNSHVTLSAWQRCQGASGKGFTHTQWKYIVYTCTCKCTHNWDPVHTDFFHLHWRPSVDAPVQKHLIWVQQENKLQRSNPK